MNLAGEPGDGSRRRAWVAVQALTLARIPLALIFAVVLAAAPWGVATQAVLVALLAGCELSDLFDGLLARRLRVASEWGATLDPYADSVARMIVYWALAVSGRALAVVPLVMACRDVTVAYCRIVGASRGVSASAKWSGKLKAVVQAVGAFALVIVEPGGVSSTVSWVVLIVTLASAVEYVAASVKLLVGSSGPR